MRDLYEVLGVDKSADKNSIKKAYRKLAKEYHPDRNKAPDAADKFKEATEAYETLMDDSKRSAYDQYGFAGTQGFGGTGFEGFNAGDFYSNFQGGGFEDIFSSFFGGGGVSSRRRNNKGADLSLKLEISFLEAVWGVEKKVAFSRKIECDECLGSGGEKGSKAKTCPTCHGQGRVTKIQKTFIGSIQTVVECSDCNGTGSVIEHKCSKCGGNGIVNHKEEMNIKIPKGTPDGLTLKFSGKGNAGEKNGGYGDLYLEVEVASDGRFERSGADIYMDYTIPVTTAVLGGEVDVPTVQGDIKVKIPAGTQPERVLKLKGYGAPQFKSEEKGDQYIRIKVQIPEKLSKSNKDLWEKLANN